jgi:hypothetical protein
MAIKKFKKPLEAKMRAGIEIWLVGMKRLKAAGLPINMSALKDFEKDYRAGKIRFGVLPEKGDFGKTRGGRVVGQFVKMPNGTKMMLLPKKQAESAMGTLIAGHEETHNYMDYIPTHTLVDYQMRFDSRVREKNEAVTDLVNDLAFLAAGYPRERVMRAMDATAYKTKAAYKELMSDLKEQGKHDVARNVNDIVSQSFKKADFFRDPLVAGIVTGMSEGYEAEKDPHYADDVGKFVRSVFEGELKFEPKDYKELHNRLLYVHRVNERVFRNKPREIKVAALKRVFDRHPELKHESKAGIRAAIETLKRSPVAERKRAAERLETAVLRSATPKEWAAVSKFKRERIKREKARAKRRI